MFLINMIRSGLVNQRKGGGFEEGFPHERDARNIYDIRPYVDSMDTGFQKPSDFSIIIPKAVSYAHIFSKKLTPSEKVFLARQVKRGLKRAARTVRKVYTGKDEFDEAKPLPDSTEYGEEKAPVEEPSLQKLLSSEDTAWEDEFATRDDLYKEELEAADVVYPPAPRETFAEMEDAEMDWENGELPSEDVVMDRKSVESDDIAITKENSFGGKIIRVKKRRAEKYTPRLLQNLNAVRSNGVGPRARRE